MAIQTINIGNSANDGNGEPARSAFNKVNQNFTNNAHAASRMVGVEAGNVMDVGAFGIGGSMVNIPMPSDTQFLGSGFYYFDVGGSSSTWQQVETNVFVMRASFANIARGFELGCLPYSNKFYLRGNADAGASWRTPVLIRHSGNTAIDANGFIKAASPIAKLFADKVEPNNEAAEQNITFKKIDIGHYLIQGSSGFALEGWYIETPKDANGNILFAVNYEQLENGDIEVKSYKKKFDLESASIVADLENPMDITQDRWIDIRLQEVPRPVPEMPTEEVNSDEPQQ